jgi:hypothetical protein
VAVGFQHLSNGNVNGARALLHDGCGRILERTLEGVPLDPFGRRFQRTPTACCPLARTRRGLTGAKCPVSVRAGA